MKHIKVVIGSNFGDEGKGLMTHIFSKIAKDDSVLNVLYNGGVQRGHTVNGHVFHCFGSGAFDGATTFYDEDFMVNPIGWNVETSELGYAPNLIIHPEARVTTPFDMEINRAIERRRGDSRHGSCGMGIFETKQRTYSVPIYVKDLTDEYILYKKLQEVRRYAEERCKELKLSFDISSVSIDDFMVSSKKMIDHSKILGDETLSLFDTVIYEAGQGLLLSQSNMDYFPNLTPSFTGSEIISFDINNAPKDTDIEICYVTRPYLTRHGAGRFDTECKKNEINPLIVDKTNQPNEFQEFLRFGYFDIDSFIDRVERDFNFYKRTVTKSVAITQLNYTDNKLVCKNSKEDVYKITDNFDRNYLLDNEEF